MKLATVVSLLLACSLTVLLPLSLPTSEKTLLTGIVSILLAGLFPTMTLTISLMTSDSLSVASITKLHDELKATINLLSGTYVLGILSVFALLGVSNLESINDWPRRDVYVSFARGAYFSLLLLFLIRIPLVLGSLRKSLAIKFIIAKEITRDNIDREGKLELKSATGPGYGSGYGQDIDFEPPSVIHPDKS